MTPIARGAAQRRSSFRGSLWLGLLAAAGLAAGCGQTDPCASVSKSVACLTIDVQGYTGQLDGTTFIFSGAEQAQQVVALVDTSGHKVTKTPFTVGFAVPNLMMAGSVQVQCLADFNQSVVAFGDASASLTPGVHGKAITLTLSGALGDMDFGDLSTPADAADGGGDAAAVPDLTTVPDLSGGGG